MEFIKSLYNRVINSIANTIMRGLVKSINFIKPLVNEETTLANFAKAIIGAVGVVFIYAIFIKLTWLIAWVFAFTFALLFPSIIVIVLTVAVTLGFDLSVMFAMASIFSSAEIVEI